MLSASSLVALAPRSLRSRKEQSLRGDKQVVSNGISVLAENALLDVVQNRGLEAFTDCPWREILLNAANAKPFMELGSYLRSPGPGGHNIRRWITPASGSK
jgi:hypothetical protein